MKLSASLLITQDQPHPVYLNTTRHLEQLKLVALHLPVCCVSPLDVNQRRLVLHSASLFGVGVRRLWTRLVCATSSRAVPTTPQPLCGHLSRAGRSKIARDRALTPAQMLR